MDYLKRAGELMPQMVADRRYLHQNPEVGFELPKTTAFVCEKLREIGLVPKMVGKSGITATIGDPARGKTILLRADMDALPMREDSGLPFASTCERAHTCGHDMHTAMLLGAARLLKENEKELCGCVRLMFQPAEEILGGAKDMLENGILEAPHVDAAMGAHMLPMAPTGFIGYGKGAVSASSDTINITVTGKGGHGASPQNTIDPINVMVHIHLALQELIAREATPGEVAVLTFGRFQAGEANNIIPQTAFMGGSLRMYDKKQRAFMLERIEQVTKSIAEAFRAEAKFENPHSTCALVIDERMADIIGEGFGKLFGPRAACLDQKMSGSEDFAEVAERVPSMFFVVGGGTPENGYCYGGHHPKVMFDENALQFGAAAYACGASYWLSSSDK